MLEYLVQLPYDLLGQSMIGFLDLIDIIQFENASTSHKSKKLLKAILPYCSPIVLSDYFNQVILKQDVADWFINRQCRIKFVRIDLEVFCEAHFEHTILDNIDLCLGQYASFRHTSSLQNQYINQKIVCVKIKSDQHPAVMEVLFSLLTSSSVRSLHIQSSNLSKWMVHIKQIGPCLCELSIPSVIPQFQILKTITEYCPHLEKLSLGIVTRISQSTGILQSIATNCPHLRFLAIKQSYLTSTEADADLTAFAEKCPQLEELSLYAHVLTDKSVIALAQHCSRLKKLELTSFDITATSLIALSERGLPLEELDIYPWIPIPTAEIATQCAHALSRIRKLKSATFSKLRKVIFYVLQYMTGLRNIVLESYEDHQLVPHLLLLHEHCARLESLTIMSSSSINPQQFIELVKKSSNLLILHITHAKCVSDAVLVELSCSCPQLQKISMYNINNVTEQGVLAFVVHCRQLRQIFLYIPNMTAIEETVRQLAQHCRLLIKLNINVDKKQREVIASCSEQYSIKEIRALRETSFGV